jgi:hypothetical protein
LDDNFFQQKDGIAMGSSLSLIVSNSYMEHFEKLAHDSVKHKPSPWLCYVDDTFVIWPRSRERLQNFLSHLINVKPSIQFMVEIGSAIPSLDVLVIRKEMALVTKAYREPTRTGRYLSFISNFPLHMKRS